VTGAEWERGEARRRTNLPLLEVEEERRREEVADFDGILHSARCTLLTGDIA